jgi:hypothetical protein
VSPTAGEVTRYRLDDLHTEATRKLPFDGIQAAAMGCASTGPLLVAGSRGVLPLNTETLRPLETDLVTPVGNYADMHGLVASADGNWFGVNGRGVASLLAYTYGADSVAVRSGGQQIVPSPLGTIVHGDRPRSTNLEPLSLDGLPWGLSTIPSTREPFYLSIYSDARRNLNGTADQLVSIHASSQARPLVSWNWQRQPTQTTAAGLTKTNLPDHKRLLFHVPLGKVLSLEDPGNRITIRQFNLVGLLNGSALDGPVITSLPPFEATPDELYRYQIDGWSRHGELTTELLSGPDGMTVSSNGEVSWTPEVGAGGKAESLLFRVHDNLGHETFHTYQLHVVASGSNERPSPSKPSVAGNNQEQTSANRIDLPAPCHRVIPCGGGRYLALHLPSLQRVAIADLHAGKLVGYAEAKAETILIAGTRDAVYVVDAQKRNVKKRSLPSIDPMWEKQLPGSWIPAMVVSGCNSAGPILFAEQDGSAHLVQADDLSLSSIAPESSTRRLGASRLARLEAAPGGNVFAVMMMPMSGTSSYLLTRQPTSGYTSVSTRFVGHRAVFNADGSRVYGQRGVYTLDGQRQLETIDPTIPAYTVPALQGPFFARYTAQEFGTSSRPAAEARIQLFLEDQERALATLPAASVFEGELIGREGGGGVDVGERMFFAPSDGILAVLPLKNNVVHLHRFDLDTLLAEAAVDYLFVASDPRRIAQAGERYEYSMVAKSSTDSVELSLESGPEGARLSGDGKLTWQVPLNWERTEETVIIKISNGRDVERFHSFIIQVEPSASDAPEVPTAFRNWTERATGRQIEAKLIEVVGEAVQLERRDGRQFIVPLNRLSNEDNAFARDSQKPE